ncbi:Deubiquitinating protein VCIP135 [Liparis tanakae]|uniref:ubiquitinyl hydrolase 1 n=1 Tax=Liparis tanakae TaxID=230148 RepID=A0A4Z2EW94_9TELE|nr:Deubiquitinating protein VCIP135 [Liparis tanakae]
MSLLTSSKKKDKRVLSGSCPDPRCQARLFFPAHGSASIECTECGQRHEQRQLLGVEEVTDPDVVLHNLLRNALLGVTGAPKKGTELVKVMGLSNYHCKLLSPVLTRYGMDKQTGKAKLLREMNQGEMFDCSLLGDRAFLIEPDHVSTVGYGRDRSGSLAYLHDTLEEVKKANGGGECLVPVHVDGDGHCLVHAVSRALVGRELFWHALRENLKQNFKQNLDCYKALFQDFIDAAEWEDIINECDPLFVPPEGVPLGLRNIHIFGLANVLHRPIVLLDSLSGMRSPGDYSATFLPGLVPEERCRGKDGSLNKPICIAWSSSGRNHYIPLVGVRNAAPPTLPARLLPKAWGVPQELIRKYVKLEPDGGCVIGGDRGLQDKYLLRLYVYRRTGVIGVQPEEVTEAAKKSVTEHRLRRCLVCGALSELHVPPEWLVPGGKLYDLAAATHGQLRPDKNYSFPLSSVVCSYDPRSDALAPDYKGSALAACSWCHGTAVRRVLGSGAVAYLDGDRTNARSHGGKCGCGFKHFWEGEEYDNLPEAFPITLEWAGRAVRETVFWFQYEAAGSALNSNVYAVAMKLVTKHFPGEFGSELLVQKVVNTILHHTAKKNPDEYNPVAVAGAHDRRLSDGAEAAPDPRPPAKIILTGPKSKTLHREELTMSRAERGVQQSIGERAAVSQRRRTDQLEQDQRVQDQKDQRVQDQKDQRVQDQKDQDQRVRDQKDQDQKDQDQKEKKIRVTTSDGRQAMLTLRLRTTFSELQASISGQFGVPPARQCIRHGFPPRELPPPAAGEEDEPAALRHGDRVTVEILRAPEDGDPGAAGLGVSGSHAAAKAEDVVAPGRTSDRELQDSIDLEMSSLCEDVWSYAKKLPHLFQQGGVFYNIVKKDMGLMEGKHCTLPHLTGKTFVCNAAEERLELCVDAAGHFPVGPDVEELATEALVRLRSETATGGSREGSPSHGALRPGGGGVVRKKEQSVTAFQGKGHSLGSAGAASPPERRPITRQHSSGVDLSASVSRGPPDLSDIPEDATREPVRMAPGFVTTKDGRGPDRGLMEQQRRKLQEMVSSIQASMERHLQAAGAGGGGTNKSEAGAPPATEDADERPAAAGPPAAGKADGKGEEPEEMESQDDEQTEPMDHS